MSYQCQTEFDNMLASKIQWARTRIEEGVLALLQTWDGWYYPTGRREVDFKKLATVVADRVTLKQALDILRDPFIENALQRHLDAIQLSLQQMHATRMLQQSQAEAKALEQTASMVGTIAETIRQNGLPMQRPPLSVPIELEECKSETKHSASFQLEPPTFDPPAFHRPMLQFPSTEVRSKREMEREMRITELKADRNVLIRELERSESKRMRQEMSWSKRSAESIPLTEDFLLTAPLKPKSTGKAKSEESRLSHKQRDETDWIVRNWAETRLKKERAETDVMKVETVAMLKSSKKKGTCKKVAAMKKPSARRRREYTSSSEDDSDSDSYSDSDSDFDNDFNLLSAAKLR